MISWNVGVIAGCNSCGGANRRMAIVSFRRASGIAIPHAGSSPSAEFIIGQKADDDKLRGVR
jgi:hypothetical protein